LAAVSQTKCTSLKHTVPCFVVLHFARMLVWADIAQHVPKRNSLYSIKKLRQPFQQGQIISYDSKLPIEMTNQEFFV